MTVLTRWDPYREFNTLQDRVNRLFHESFSNEGQGRVPGAPRASLPPSTSTKTSTTSR